MKKDVLREGVFCALWIPTDVSGKVLFDEIDRTLDRLRASKVPGLMVLGSTGEFLHLDIAQRREVLEKLGASAQDFCLMANISEISPRIASEMGRVAAASGFHCVSLLPPWFFGLSQEDIAEFLVQVGRASGLPVWLYNFVERTGHKIEIESIRRAFNELPLAGVKQSGADFEYHKPLVALGRELGFSVLTGSDTNMGEAMELGAAGSVSGLANVLPELVMEMYHNARRDGGLKASQSDAGLKLAEVGRMMGGLTFPLNVASILKARGINPGSPKACVSRGSAEASKRLVEEAQSKFQQWGLV